MVLYVDGRIPTSFAREVPYANIGLSGSKNE